MNNKVLVTGGCGYIGSHTVVELLEAGMEVVVVDNLSNSKIEALDAIKKLTGVRPVFEKVDLCSKTEVSNFFEKYKDIENIIHFAAFKAVGESVQFPMLYYQNNMLSIINILDEVRKTGKKTNFVFSSSCAVYGNSDILPVNENLPLGEPTSPYGNTKKFAEIILKDATTQINNFKTIALRYFNPIGAHPSGIIGEAPLKTYNLIPILTETATGKRQEMLVFGNNYNTPDGTCVRDYIHVVDIAKAHIIALKRLINGNNSSDYEYFNLGLGRGFSVLEVINSFEKVSQKKIKFKIVDRREGDVAEVYADIAKANSVLKWRAEYDLDQMLLSAWKWENEFRNY